MVACCQRHDPKAPLASFDLPGEFVLSHNGNPSLSSLLWLGSDSRKTFLIMSRNGANTEPVECARSLQTEIAQLIALIIATNHQSLRLLAEMWRISIGADKLETDHGSVKTEPYWYPWAMIAGLFAMLVIAAKFLAG